MAISEIDDVLRRYRAAIARIGILRAFTRATISALRFTRSILPRPYSGLAPGSLEKTMKGWHIVRRVLGHRQPRGRVDK